VVSGEESPKTQSSDFYLLASGTGSTVGYGDFSPSTDAGNNLSLFIIIPMGLSILLCA